MTLEEGNTITNADPDAAKEGLKFAKDQSKHIEGMSRTNQIVPIQNKRYKGVPPPIPYPPAIEKKNKLALLGNPRSSDIHGSE